MPVHYCSLHTRLWSGIYREWVDFPLEKIQAIQTLYALFYSANIETSAYQVRETRCDRCQAKAGQQRREELK
jgi:uncharacterized paraquat-inducible protein A